MRIIAGRWGGRKLAPLGKGDDGARLRPTPDRVRESLFSLLTARGMIEDARVLDLFAGTGALGLEALSRGASEVVHVENGRTGQRLIRQNIALLDASTSTVFGTDAMRLGPCPQAPFDLVFLDPPYGKGMGERALASAAKGGWLSPDCLVVWEEQAPMTAPDGFETILHKRYGDVCITLLAHRTLRP